MQKENRSILCLVSLSPSRSLKLHNTKEEERIIKRLQTIFADIPGPVDTVPGCFNLNQKFYETKTCLATSYGLMDFVTIPLCDSIWINHLYVTGKLDIQVNYIYNYGKENVSYVPHRSFPELEGLTFHQYPEERSREFYQAFSNMLDNHGLIDKEDLY